MENFDRENIDKLLEICQICQQFSHQNFASFGVYTIHAHSMSNCHAQCIDIIIATLSLCI